MDEIVQQAEPWTPEQMFLTIADLVAGSGLPVPRDTTFNAENAGVRLRFDSVAELTAWADTLGGFSVYVHTYRPEWRDEPITSVYQWRTWGGWHLGLDAWDPATPDEIDALEAREAAELAQAEAPADLVGSER
jgi:hypothetical protein